MVSPDPDLWGACQVVAEGNGVSRPLFVALFRPINVMINAVKRNELAGGNSVCVCCWAGGKIFSWGYGVLFLVGGASTS